MRRHRLVWSLCFFALPVAYVPAWWQQGWPRGRVDSLAEAELLSELAVLLMPGTEIGELFRSFPAPEGWGGHALEPDLAAHGVLKDKHAALFVEYDGFWRHGEKEGITRDRKKNAALLAYAPEGSFVVRIAHKVCKPGLHGQILWVQVDAQHQGNRCSLTKTLQSILTQMVVGLQKAWHSDVIKQFQQRMASDQWTFSDHGQKFVAEAAVRAGKNSSQECDNYFASEGFSQQHIKIIHKGLKSHSQSIEGNLRPKVLWLLELGLSKMQVAKAVARYPQILSLSIDQNLNPTVDWFLGLGLSKMKVAKAVARYPQILSLSIDQNLNPTVDWFLGLGLSKMKVAKAAATYPQILALSIDQNLNPTVEWFLDLGLSKMQVAKAVASFAPILYLSIDQNLNPTVEWFLGLGLSKMQVAKAVASFAPILDLSIDQNLNPTVEWFLDLGLSKMQVAKAVARFPSILALSIDQNLNPTVEWFVGLGLSKMQVAKAVAAFPQILAYSTDHNLKLTVEWFLDLGLSEMQVAKAVASFPQILSLSIEQNLQPKCTLLLSCFAHSELIVLVACNPRVFSYSYSRLSKRLSILAVQNKTAKLVGALTLCDERFFTFYRCHCVAGT